MTDQHRRELLSETAILYHDCVSCVNRALGGEAVLELSVYWSRSEYPWNVELYHDWRCVWHNTGCDIDAALDVFESSLVSGEVQNRITQMEI